MSRPEVDAHLRVDQLTSDIRRQSLRGGAIAFGAQGLKFALQFGTVVVLARLLAPEAFGLIAMAAALNGVLDLVKEFGLSAATIQKSDITHSQVSALFWINAAIGVAIAILLLLGAPAIAEFYGQPELLAVTRWLALPFLLSGLTTQHWALLRRQMRFGAIALLETGTEILGFALVIGLALGGAGYWALIAQRMLGPALLLVGCWSLCGWRPGWPTRAPGLAALVGFGSAVTSCNLAVAFARSIDQILIGWLWGPAVLGLYERSVKLLLMPITNIAMPLYAVGMPMLSRLNDEPRRYRAAFIRLIEHLAMATMPAGALVVVASDWLVVTLFGDQWRAATPLVAFFGLAVSYQPVTMALGLVFMTQNRGRDLLHAALIDSVLAVILIVAGLPFGVVGVAGFYSVGGLVLRAPLYTWFATRHSGIVPRDVYQAVLPSAGAALIVAGVAWGVRHIPGIDTLVCAERLAIALVASGLGATVIYGALPRSRRALVTLAGIPRSLHAPRPSTRS